MPDPEPSGNSFWQRRARAVRQLSNHRFWTSTKGILTGLAAIATVVSVAIKVVPTSEACDSNNATLSNPQITQGTYESLLNEIRSGDNHVTSVHVDPDKLDDPVIWASVFVSSVGHKGKTLIVKWSAVDTKAGDLRTNQSVEYVPPSCGENSFRPVVHLPPIAAGRRVHVIFDLVDEDNKSLPPHKVQTRIIQASQTTS